MEKSLIRYEKLLKKAKQLENFNSSFLEAMIKILQQGKQLSQKQVIAMVKIENFINTRYEIENRNL